jgi:FxsC-like protein
VWAVAKSHEVARFRSIDPYDEGEIAEEWRPFLPDCDDPARLIAQDAAREARLTYVCRPFPETRKELQRLIDEGGDNYTPVVVVVDVWSLRIHRYRAIVNIFDKGTLAHCCVIFPWNRNDRETSAARRDLRDGLAEVFPFQFTKSDTTLIFDAISDVASFKSRLTRVLVSYVADVNRSLNVARRLPENSAFGQPPQLSPPSGSLL